MSTNNENEEDIDTCTPFSYVPQAKVVTRMEVIKDYQVHDVIKKTKEWIESKHNVDGFKVVSSNIILYDPYYILIIYEEEELYS